MKNMRSSALLFIPSLALLIFLCISVTASFISDGQTEPQKGLASSRLAENPVTLTVLSSENNYPEAVAAANKSSFECISAESGGIFSNKTVCSSLVVGYFAGGVASQAFLSYDISSIPEDSIIEKATLDLRRCDVSGDPFLNLGCLKAYPIFYSTLKSDDYFNSLPMGEIMSICSEGDLGNMKKAYPSLAKSLQNAVGSSRFQIRLQFGRRDTISVGIRDNDLGVIGGKGISEGPRTEVVGEASGEWKPCLPAEENPQKPLRNTKRTVNEKDLLQFGGIRLVVTYIPPK